MSAPSVTVLVHGGPGSIETVRVRGLTRRHPTDRLRILFREGGARATAVAWNRAIREQRPDLVYVLNTASPGSILAPVWSHLNSIPYVLDTGDAVFEMARTSGVGGGWKLPLLWFFERFAHREASAIVVRGTRHRELLESQGRKRVVVIRDGFAENQSVSDESVAALRHRLGLQGRFVAGVMGSTVLSPRLGICYGWDLVEALSGLKDLPVTALVIGDGPGLDWLKEKARSSGVADRVLFTGRIPYPEVPLYLRLMDVALSTQTNNLPGRVRTTGKVPEYMAAGRFILASRVGDAEILLPEPMLLEYQGEVDPKYPGRLAARIREVFHSDDLRRLGATLPERANRLCSYETLSTEWSRLVGSLA